MCGYTYLETSRETGSQTVNKLTLPRDMSDIPGVAIGAEGSKMAHNDIK